MLIVRDLTTHWLGSRFLVSKIGMLLEQAREHNSVSFNEIFCSFGRVAQFFFSFFLLPCEHYRKKRGNGTILACQERYSRRLVYCDKIFFCFRFSNEKKKYAIVVGVRECDVWEFLFLAFLFGI